MITLEQIYYKLSKIEECLKEKEKPSLKEGFYWVKSKEEADWRVLERCHNTWWLPAGIQACEPEVIGPRILPPE